MGAPRIRRDDGDIIVPNRGGLLWVCDPVIKGCENNLTYGVKHKSALARDNISTTGMIPALVYTHENG